MPVSASPWGNLLSQQMKSPESFTADRQAVEAGGITNALNTAKLGEYQQGLQRSEQLRNMLSSGAGSDQLMKGGFLKEGMDLAKNNADVGNINAQETGHRVESFAKKAAIMRSSIGSVPSPQAAARYMQQAFADPDMGPVMKQFGTLEDALSEIPSNPNDFRNWQMQASEGIGKLVDHAEEQRTQAETARNNKAQNGIAAGQLGVAQGNLSLSRQRLTMDQNAPKGQIVQTDQGTMLVDPRGATATPVIGPGGVALTKPLKDIPANVNTAIITNSQNLNKVNQAIDLLSGKDVGALKGDKDATGWKGYAPQAILNRSDPKGVDTRAMISDIGSLILHDRSGAAITASESPRLMPFIPLATDDNPTALKKLTRFKQLYEQEQQAFADTYSKDQGYRPSPTKSAGGAPSKTANGATVSNW